MRVIEQQMLDAVRNRKDWHSANTRVSVTHFPHSERAIDRINVYLHDNLIAEIDPMHVAICDCGWQTSTTKSRLNVLLKELCDAGVYQKSHRWYGYALEETDWEIEPRTRHLFVRK